MILISGLKQLQNIAAFHNEERNHSSMWEEEGEEGGGGEGRRGGKEGQCEGEQRGGSRERMCACSARKFCSSKVSCLFERD